jgi:hypothetical protein
VLELRRQRESDASYPDVLVFHLASVADGEEFFRERWPEVAAVADAEGRFYGAFGRRRARLWEALRPRLWLAGLRAFRQGHRPSRAVGDAWRMPGLFLVANGTVRWAHDYRDPGDHPDFAAVPRVG